MDDPLEEELKLREMPDLAHAKSQSQHAEEPFHPYCLPILYLSTFTYTYTYSVNNLYD